MKFHLNFETFGALAAIIASFAALFVAWDQARVMRAEQHAGAWPYGYMSTDFSVDEQYDYTELTLANPGVGPALVREAYLLSDGEPVANWWDLVDRTFPEDLQESVEFGGAGSAMGVLAVGEERSIIRINWPRATEADSPFNLYLQQAISGNAPMVGLRICYCSVYGRCWRAESDLNSQGQDHEEVDQCDSTPDFITTFFVATEEQLAAAAAAPANEAPPADNAEPTPSTESSTKSQDTVE